MKNRSILPLDRGVCFKFLLCFILSISPLSDAGAVEALKDAQASGYIKSYLSNVYLNDEPAQAVVQNNVRFQLNGNLSQGATLEFAYELLPVYQKNDSSTFENLHFAGNINTSADYRFIRSNASVFNNNQNEGLKLYQNWDRFNARISTKHADITVGRQAITFGVARSIQPTDVLVPFGLLVLNTEYRTGVDAIRAEIALGEMSELDLGVVVGRDAKQETSALFARLKQPFGAIEATFIALNFKKANMLGLSLQRSFNEVGAWIETATVKPDREADYTRVSAGVDYSFHSDILTQIEYHYNSAGANDPGRYLNKLDGFAYQKGGVFLLGRHYLIPGLFWMISPLLSAGGNIFINLNDHSTLTSATLEYNATENIYLDFGAYLSSGKTTDTDKIDESGVNSEYGLYGSMIFMDIRWYF